MQFTIDSAQRNYLLRMNLANKKREEELSKPSNLIPAGVEVTLLDKSAAILAGASITGIVSNLKQTNSKFFLTHFEKIENLPTYEESQKAAESMLEDSNLKSKGVKVLFVENNKDGEKVIDIIQKNTLMNFKKRFNIGENNIISRGIKYYAKRIAPTVVKGHKSSYYMNEKVAVTSKSTHQQIFHEIGLAKVAENKALRPILTLGKKLPVVAVISGLLALQYTPRMDCLEKPKTWWDKTQDFLDNNSGKIVFATYMPLLAEKYMASRYGLQHIEKHMDQAKVKSVRRLYNVGLVTYLASAFAAAAGVGLGNKVQNNIIKQKQSPQDVTNLLI